MLLVGASLGRRDHPRGSTGLVYRAPPLVGPHQLLSHLAGLLFSGDSPPFSVALQSTLASLERPGLGFLVDLDASPSEATPVASAWGAEGPFGHAVPDIVGPSA